MTENEAKNFHVNTDMFGQYAKIPTGRSGDLHIQEAEEKRTARIKSIESIRNTRYRTVLRMYYISGMSFFKISCILGKSERNIQDIHKKAIKQVQIDGQN